MFKPVQEFIAVDLETTGLDFENDTIIEIAMARFSGDDVVQTLDCLVRPGFEISPFIENLTGITNAELKLAKPFGELAAEIMAFIGDLPLVAHNSKVDLHFLNKSFHPYYSDPIPNLVLDSLLAARVAWPALENHRLETLVREFKLEKNSHRALPDAMNCGKLFNLAQKKLATLPEGVLNQMSYLVNNTSWSVLFENHTKTPVDITLKSETPAPAGELQHRHKEKMAYWFGDNGVLQEKIPGFQPRGQQLKLAQDVDKNLHMGNILLAEAPTGTGKTLAYLLPLAQKAVLDRERVYISTASKTLQEQLWNQELPKLKEIFGSKLKPAILKGRNNYLCLRKYHDHLENADDLLKTDEKEAFLTLPQWIAETSTGDISENSGFNPVRNRVIWTKVASESQTCVGESCQYFKQCFGLNSRRKAMDSNLVITNHHLFFNDLQLEFSLLPSYEHIVFDEAHRLPDLGSQVLSRKIWFFRLRNTLNLMTNSYEPGKGLISVLEKAYTLNNEITDNLKELRECVDNAEKKIHRFLMKLGKNCKKMKGEKLQYVLFNQSISVEFNTSWDEVTIALENLNSDLQKLQALILPMNNSTGYWKDLEGIRQSVDEFNKDFQFIAEARDPDWAYWIEEFHNPHKLNLQAAPMNLHEVLGRKFYSWVRSVTYVSATLSIKESFEYFENRMGVPNQRRKRVNHLICRDSFNLDQQMKVLIPANFPKPQDENFNAHVKDWLSSVLPKVDASSLVLFTSISSLKEIHGPLSDSFKKEGKSLFAQHVDGNWENLLDLFRKSPQGCLMGTQVYWEGIDLPGKQLEVLVIVKLPFPNISDPLVQAWNEKLKKMGLNSFREYLLPEAVLELKQGIGRLLRGSGDRGVVLVLDSRILTEPYGVSFSRAWKNNHQIINSTEDAINACTEFLQPVAEEA